MFHRTIRPSPFILSCTLMLFAPACDISLGGDTEGGDTEGTDTGTTGDETGGKVESGDPVACSDTEPCPEGERCFNGLCALECSQGEDGSCPPYQHCRESLGLCVYDNAFVCENDGDCAESQVCVLGFCSTAPTTSCDVFSPYDDGCLEFERCLDPDGDGVGACYSLQACEFSDTCPVGHAGALCNVDPVTTDPRLPNKDAVCLLGMCETDANCPANWTCVRLGGDAAPGLCSDGSPDSACKDGSQCASGTCVPSQGLEGGFCQ